MATRTARDRPTAAEGILLIVAGVWSAVVLPVGAFVAPLYSGVSSDLQTGETVHSTASTIEVNGLWVLGYVSIPIVVTALVAAMLWYRAAGRGAGAVAWTATGALAAFTLVSMMTIGMFLLPVTGCLIAACGVRQARRRGAARQ